MQTRNRKHQCGICHEHGADTFSNHCTPGMHFFCRACLRKWAETENTCPVCKVEFDQIVTRQGMVVERGIKRKRQSEGEEEEIMVTEMERQLVEMVLRQYSPLLAGSRIYITLSRT